jgi:hypothetical protein
MHLALRLSHETELQRLWKLLKEDEGCKNMGGEVLKAEMHLRSDGVRQFWVRDPAGLVWEVMIEPGRSRRLHPIDERRDMHAKQGTVDVREQLQLVGPAEEPTPARGGFRFGEYFQQPKPKMLLRPPSTPTARRSWAVASGNPIVADVAEHILRAGGSAADAAVAAMLVQGVVEPMNAGLGGDMLAMVVDAHSRIATGLVAVGRSPELRTPAELNARVAALRSRRTKRGRGGTGPSGDIVASLPQYGHLSVTSPGVPAGCCAMHARFGRLAWADVVRQSHRNSLPSVT